MGYYNDLDQEIDQEMGWRSGKKKRLTPVSGENPPEKTSFSQILTRIGRVTTPLWRWAGNLVRGFGKILFFPIISPLSYSKRFNAEGDLVVIRRPWFWRIGDALLTRLLLTPVILTIFLIAVVYGSTHPQLVHAVSSPTAYGLYYKPVNLVTIDNVRLGGLYIPPLSADELAADPDAMLSEKWPAVVVCHGLGESHDQYMLLSKELHDAGFAVLMVDTRGQGESAAAPVTYGLRERLDVLSGVKYLRDMAYIDETKVCVVGHGIGATAALQAATLDSAIAAVVADGLWPQFQDRARQVFSQAPESWNIMGVGAGAGARLPTAWLAPLYTMTFEIAVQDSLSELDPVRVLQNIHKQPVLFIARSGPQYDPLADVIKLSQTEGSKHEVFVDDPNLEGDSEARIRDFLVKVTGWVGPKVRGMEQVQKLMQSEIKP